MKKFTAKKFILLLLVLALAFSTFACGRGEAQTSGADEDCMEEVQEPEVILPEEQWVRTSATLHETPGEADIAGFAPKGTRLEILDYNAVLDDGRIDMYKVRCEDGEAWVYAKYLVDTEDEALALNEAYTSIHRGRKWKNGDLMGGLPENLDYYPVEKPVFEDNPPLEYSNAMFLLFWKAWELDGYLELAKEKGVNAIVLDIKNNYLGYKSDVAAELCPTAYERAFLSVDDYRYMVNRIKDEGFYLIGRIVTFKDEEFAKDYPEECITTGSSISNWPSPFSRKAWEYNAKLACEAVELFGFNEIQFDYLRFPSNSYQLNKAGKTDFKNVYGEEMAQGIQNFLFYACDCIHEAGAYVSADVFGECSDEYVTAYGQYWPAISNVVDVTSSMPYLDHFGEDPRFWEDPYTTIYNWASAAATRQTEIPTPSVARTWLTCYNTPYWDPKTFCGAEYMRKQVNALKDAGLTGGFMPWNGSNTLSKYKDIADVWLDYGNGE